MKQPKKWAMAAILAVTPLASAHADRATNDCKFYSAERERAPADVAELLRKAPGTFIRKCTPKLEHNQARYDVFSPTWGGPSGVCYTRSQQLYRIRGAQAHLRWSYQPFIGASRARPISIVPQLYMARPNTKCPSAISDEYVPVEGVSEGMFLSLVTAWEKMSNDAKLFDNAFAKLGNSTKSSPTFAQFRRSVLGLNGRRLLSIASISYSGPLPTEGLGVPSMKRLSDYSLRIYNQSDDTEAYELELDIANSGLSISNFRAVKRQL